ncbi:MAG: bifunctional phosphoribosyl-AMP cyclohydrolase/phosphoribosyl-ATP diphosphatase HisIE [Gammaproteobacteria bacterium]
MIDQLDFEKSPLIPAIVQDATTRQVLMLGFMNREAVEKTIASNRVTFYSRSRQTLWTKGETSGNTLALVALYPDCDHDTLLVLANPAGPTCHRNTVACFDEPAPAGDVLSNLEHTIRSRIDGEDEASYVSSLVQRGLPRVAQKVGEEGVETALAATTGTDEETISESADLLFHLLVLLNAKGLTLDQVREELRRRQR